MKLLRFPRESTHFESDRTPESSFRVDYFDTERQNWIACESLSDHIFDDDDGMWPMATFGHEGEPRPGHTFDDFRDIA